MENFGNNGNKIKQKKITHFCCEKCQYITDRKSNINNHYRSAKHLKDQNGNNFKQKLSNLFLCEYCSKKYQTSAGLWKHKKKCKINNEQCDVHCESNDDTSDKDQLIMMLIQQNSQLIKEHTNIKQMMIEQQNIVLEIAKNGTHNTTNNTTHNHTNSHNQSFNLNFFLNETCKDALNISDFVDSIKLSLDDLEYTGRKGYIEGITNIVLKNLKNMEEYKRPIHCSDYKREILYIKENDTWKKENDNRPLLTNAIKVIANENIKQIKEWKEQYPDCTDSESKKNNLYLKIVSNSMSGIDREETNKNISKIISNVAKEVIINK